MRALVRHSRNDFVSLFLAICSEMLSFCHGIPRKSWRSCRKVRGEAKFFKTLSLRRLKYPNQLQKIEEMASESVLKMAVDFDGTKGHPRLAQVNLIPSESGLETVSYAMEYKPASSKAILNIVTSIARLLFANNF